MTWVIISAFAGLALVIGALAIVVKALGHFEIRIPPKKDDIVIRFGRKKDEKID